jgi:hypothetical protein
VFTSLQHITNNENLPTFQLSNFLTYLRRINTMSIPKGNLSTQIETGAAESKQLSRGWRYTLSALLLITAGGAVTYQLLDAAQLKQTSALFIGLPLLIGLLTVNLTRARGLYGQVLRANVIGLALVAPLLGEGSICLLMAAPLFIGFSLIIAVLYDLLRRPRSLLCLALLPLLLGLAEKYTDIFTPQPEVVATTVTLAGNLTEWRARVQNIAPVAASDSFFLNLGFPLPTAYTKAGDDVIVTFKVGQQKAGFWWVQRHLNADGVFFEIETDTTPISNWIALHDSQVTLREMPGGSIQLTQTTRFTPLLFPMWYFVPFERYAIEQTHKLALATWTGASQPVWGESDSPWGTTTRMKPTY